MLRSVTADAEGAGAPWRELGLENAEGGEVTRRGCRPVTSASRRGLAILKRSAAAAARSRHKPASRSAQAQRPQARGRRSSGTAASCRGMVAALTHRARGFSSSYVSANCVPRMASVIESPRKRMRQRLRPRTPASFASLQTASALVVSYWARCCRESTHMWYGEPPSCQRGAREERRVAARAGPRLALTAPCSERKSETRTVSARRHRRQDGIRLGARARQPARTSSAKSSGIYELHARGRGCQAGPGVQAYPPQKALRRRLTTSQRARGDCAAAWDGDAAGTAAASGACTMR